MIDEGFSRFAHVSGGGPFVVECGDGQEVYRTVGLMPPKVGSPTAIGAVQAVERCPRLNAIEVSATERARLLSSTIGWVFFNRVLT